MPVALRFVNIGLAQCADPILQHVARSRVDQAQGKTSLVIFGRGYSVGAVLGEEVRPAVELPSPHDRVEIHRLTIPSTGDRHARSRAQKPRSSGWALSYARNRPSPGPNNPLRTRGSRAG